MDSVNQIDTNLQGQKLGNKGRVTRERILTSARELIYQPNGEDFTLSAVARHTGLRMSSIYNYFADLTELVLALLDPLTEEAEDAFLAQLREEWADDELALRWTQFVNAFQMFWQRHSRLLHLRNRLADRHDERMLLRRIEMARVVVRLLGRQMGGAPGQIVGDAYDFASVLYTGLERVVTIATDEEMKAHYPPQIRPRFDGATLQQQARLLKLAVMDSRARSAGANAA